MPHSLQRPAVLALIALSGSAMAQTITINAVLTDHHAFNVTCFGDKDGGIDITVTGGTPPYQYTWSTGAIVQDLSDVPAGFYAVNVKDANNVTGRAEFTLTEPATLELELVPYVYPNDYNISCYNCYHGSLDVTPVGGIAPYTYEWSDGPTTQDRSMLASGNYAVTVTDANGCAFRSEQVYLSAPDRSDWTMSGNAGTNPAVQYIGTSDNKDVVFKSNGAERLRLKSSGQVRVPSLERTGGYGVVMADSTGVLKAFGGGHGNDIPDAIGCPHATGIPWTHCGNVIGPGEVLGTLNNAAFHLITNNVVRLTIRPDGKVGIGTPGPPVYQQTAYNLFVEGGISTRDVLVKTGPWPDYVFAKDYALPSIREFRHFVEEYQHLPGLPSAAEVEAIGGIEVGDMQARLIKVTEEQALYILQLEERVDILEQRLKALELIQH